MSRLPIRSVRWPEPVADTPTGTLTVMEAVGGQFRPLANRRFSSLGPHTWLSS